VPLDIRGSPRVRRPWPLAWPSPSGPLGWQRSSASRAGALDAGGANPDNARRSGSDAGDILPATSASGVTLTAWPWSWRARQRDTAGTAGGRSPGVPCAAHRRIRRALRSKDASEAGRPATARPPVQPQPSTAGHPGRSSSACLSPRARMSRLSRHVCVMPAPRPRLTPTGTSGPTGTSPPAPPSMPSSLPGRNRDGTAATLSSSGAGQDPSDGQQS
jgi:hypothetical protein